MSKLGVKPTCKKSAGVTARSGVKAGPIADFQFVDNGDSTCTVSGVDAAGNPSDISTVATLAPPPTSSDTTLVTVDAPSGMTFAMHAVGPLSTPGSPVIIAVTATWNDGSLGPFTFDLPVDVVSGGVTGIQVVPGTPTLH